MSVLFRIGRNFLGRRGRPLGMYFNHEGEDDGGGDGGGGGGGGGSDRFDVDLNLDNSGGEPNGGDGGATNIFVIPDAYKEKDYAKGIKTVDDLWKMNDNAHSMIGKKTIGVPGEGATDEEIATFNKAFGVPETPDKYEFTDSDNFKVIFGENASRDEEVVKEVKGIFHKARLSTKQANEVQKGYDGVLAKIVEKQNKIAGELNANFDALTEKTFGDKKEETLNIARDLINAHAPEGFADYLRTLPNEALTIMAGVLKNIQEKYISEDDIPRGNSTTGQSPDAIRKRIQEVIASKDFQNPLSPNHDTAKKEWINLSSQLDKMRQGK